MNYDTTTNPKPVNQASSAADSAKFKTISVFLSGGICGSMWWPSGVLGGKLVRKDARGPWGFMAKGDSFREALLSLLNREGGDFQSAQFTADTVLRIERRSVAGAGRYTVHVWEREIGELADCADLVNADAYTGDFMGGEE